MSRRARDLHKMQRADKNPKVWVPPANVNGGWAYNLLGIPVNIKSKEYSKKIREGWRLVIDEEFKQEFQTALITGENRHYKVRRSAKYAKTS